MRPRLLSLFSGIEGFGLAAERAGFEVAGQVEIDPDANRVLAHHYPHVLRWLDVCQVGKRELPAVDVITFGSPCQDFSVAGKRTGITGQRSGLIHEALRICAELRPSFAVWEGVPGTLSSHAGRDFAAILGAFRECGARDLAWRTLDAKNWGVPQRRRRVFLIGDFRGDRAGQVLFESQGGGGSLAESEEAESDVAPSVTPGARRASGNRSGRQLVVADTLHGSQGGVSNGHHTFIVNAAESCAKQSHARPSDVARCLDSTGGFASNQGGTVVVATLNSGGNRGGFGTEPGEHLVPVYSITPDAFGYSGEGSGGTAGERPGLGIIEGQTQALRAKGPNAVAHGRIVRRLTPLECLRLQGFPDTWLDLDPVLSDSVKYRLVGNAVAVPVVQWILGRVFKEMQG